MQQYDESVNSSISEGSGVLMLPRKLLYITAAFLFPPSAALMFSFRSQVPLLLLLGSFFVALHLLCNNSVNDTELQLPLCTCNIHAMQFGRLSEVPWDL